MNFPKHVTPNMRTLAILALPVERTCSPKFLLARSVTKKPYQRDLGLDFRLSLHHPLLSLSDVVRKHIRSFALALQNLLLYSHRLLKHIGKHVQLCGLLKCLAVAHPCNVLRGLQPLHTI